MSSLRSRTGSACVSGASGARPTANAETDYALPDAARFRLQPELGEGEEHRGTMVRPSARSVKPQYCNRPALGVRSCPHHPGPGSFRLELPSHDNPKARAVHDRI